MGSHASKPVETKVFDTSASSVQFSPELLSQLENSYESNYARAQLSEKIIDKQVSKKLDTLGKETYNDLLKEIEDSNAEDKLQAISSTKLDEKLTQLSSKLEEIKSNKFFQDRISKKTNEDIKKYREEVVKCLKSNTEKPLNCWDEVQKFKQSVSNL